MFGGRCSDGTFAMIAFSTAESDELGATFALT